MSDQDTAATDAMADELRRIIDQAERLMGAAGADSAMLGDLKARVHESIDVARDKLADLEREARRRGRRAAAVTEVWVMNNPWTALAIGAGIGLVVGALVMRSLPGPHSDEPDPYV